MPFTAVYYYDDDDESAELAELEQLDVYTASQWERYALLSGLVSAEEDEPDVLDPLEEADRLDDLEEAELMDGNAETIS